MSTEEDDMKEFVKYASLVGNNRNKRSVEYDPGAFEPITYAGTPMDASGLGDEFKDAICTPETGNLDCTLPTDNNIKNAQDACKAIEEESIKMREAMEKYKAEAATSNSIVAGITATVACVAAVGMIVATGGAATPLVVAAGAAAVGAGGIGGAVAITALGAGEEGATAENKNMTYIDASTKAKTIADVQNISNQISELISANILDIKGCDMVALSKLVPENDREKFMVEMSKNKSTVKDIKQEITQKATATSLLTAVADLVRKNTNDITTQAYLKSSAEALSSPASSKNSNCTIIDASNKTCDYLRTINCCNQQIHQKQTNLLKIEACNVNVSDITQSLSAESIMTCGGDVDFQQEGTADNKVTTTLTMIADAVAANIWVIVAAIAVIVIGFVVYKHFSNKGKKKGNTSEPPIVHAEAAPIASAPSHEMIGEGYRTSVQKVWKKHKLLCILTGALFVIHITKNKK
jgi:hypothetical protein